MRASPGHAARRRRWRFPGLSVAGSMGLLLVAAALAVVPQTVAPHDPIQVDVLRRLRPPAWQEGGTPGHLLGTDQLGRDIFSRVVFGTRISISVAVMAVGLAAATGVTLGLVSGFFGGLPDRALMRIAEVQLAFPAILLAITLAAILGAGFWKVVIVLAATGWVSFARVVLGATLSVRGREYVEAARAVGARPARIIWRHVLPNILASTIVIATLEVARVIIVEASLGFLGLGVQPPTPSWGNMLSDARTYVATAW